MLLNDFLPCPSRRVSVKKNQLLYVFTEFRSQLFSSSNKGLLAIASPVSIDYGKLNLDPQHICAEQMFPPY